MSMGDFSVDRWNTFVQQVGEALRVRRLGPLVFARCHWESDTPLEKLPPKLARLVETLAQWMQQPPERFYLTRKAELASVTLVVEFRPSATAIVSHARGFADLHAPTSAGVSDTEAAKPKAFPGIRPLGLDLFLLGTQGAIYLDGTQDDRPGDPLVVPDLPADHPIHKQLAQVWP